MAISDLEHPRVAARSRLLGRFFKGNSGNDSSNPREGLPPIEGVVTEQKLLQYFFKLKGIDVHPISTDTFLDKSRDEYGNPAWLSRELIQNFVDHNPEDPGTLNGVSISSESLPSGSTRFRIGGNWPFEDSTGVMTPHSDKPQDINTAGGNGLGLKQVAICLMRDLDVEKFEIQGEGWSVNYHMVKADDVNTEWKDIPGQVPLHELKHNWLLAELKEAPRTGKNQYIIETRNPEVIYALSQLNTLGVSKENPYLQDMDFQNEHGGLKWLPREEDQDGVAKGRLFINGQVMNFKSRGTTVEDYWVGPEGVTIQLNDINYRISIDRPPISVYELTRHLTTMVESMTPDQMIEQLMRSEYLWAGHPDSAAYSFNKLGYSVVLEKMVSVLSNRITNKDEAAAFFTSKGYLAWNRGVSEGQIKDLTNQGYTICSGYFEQIGMPSAGSKLSNVEVASNEKPQLTREQRKKIAQEYGLDVSFEDLSRQPWDQFIGTISSRLAPDILSVTLSPTNPHALRIKLKGEIPAALLSHPLPNPKEGSQKQLALLRSIAAYGLGRHAFEKVFTSQGEFITTYALEYDTVTEGNSLVARNIESRSDQGVFIEIELEEKNRVSLQDGLAGAAEKYKQLMMQQSAATISTEPKVASRSSEQLAVEIGGTTPTIEHQEGSPVVGISEAAEEPKIQVVESQNWSDEEELLYQQAIKKNADELNEAERLIIERRRALRADMQAVPVVHPEAPTIETKGQVIRKDSTLPEAEQERLKQMEEQLPGIVEAVNKLDQLVPEVKPAELTGQSDIEKYLAWRNSPDFYGELGDNAGYLTGKHLLELVDEQDQAEIDSTQSVREKSPNEKILGALHDKLKAVVDRINPSEDEVNDFEIVLSPSKKELAQLGLLRTYVHLLTGAALPNDLFIYQGTGSKGINLGKKAIGLHQSLFGTQFTESLRTFIHEVAHNAALDHENEFRHTMESLFVTVIDRVGEVGRKLEAREPLDLTDRVALDIQGQWNTLRQVG